MSSNDAQQAKGRPRQPPEQYCELKTPATGTSSSHAHSVALHAQTKAIFWFSQLSTSDVAFRNLYILDRGFATFNVSSNAIKGNRYQLLEAVCLELRVYAKMKSLSLTLYSGEEMLARRSTRLSSVFHLSHSTNGCGLSPAYSS